MSTVFKITKNPPSLDTFAALYIDAGWIKKADKSKLKSIFKNTSRWWTAKEKATGQVIGMARILTDWRRYACIYDVIVSKKKRKRGVGTAIMKAMLHELAKAKIDIIHLWPTKGKIAFYRRIGFKVLSREQPMMKYKPSSNSSLEPTSGHATS